MASLSLVFDLLARDRASSEFRKVGDAAERAGKAGSNFGSSVSSAVKLAAGAFLAAGIGNLFSGFVKDAQESAKISRLTAQVIKTTGGAAHITAGQVGELATAISNKTAVDDEAIQSAENLLLTFTNVRNEAGRGNDIFNQTTQAAIDMSVALGTDANGAAIQLGKALNDPIKGITALSRAGVSFTKEQKDQIRAMVEAGDVLGAQKLILAEVGREFGGAAEAAASPIDRLKVIAGNLGEQVGGYLLPIVGKLASWISDKLLPTLSRWAAAFRENIAPIISSVFGYIKDTVIPALMDFGRWIVQNRDWIVPLVAALGAGLVVFKAITLATKAWAAAQALLNVILAANPIGIVITVLAALAAGLFVVYQKSETFREIIDTAFHVIATTATWLWNNILKPVFGFIVAAFQALAAGIGLAWNNVIKPTWDAISTAATWLWQNVLQPVFGAISTAWDALGRAFGWVFDHLIKPIFDGFSRLIDTIKRGFETGVDFIKRVWEGLVDALKAPVQVVVDFVWNNGLRKLWNVINNIWDGDDIAPFRLASGGVLPGYTPGRDVHRFISPTGGILDLSGGEAVMRPEFTKALGKPTIDYLNRVARTEGEAGVAAALGSRQFFADGGTVKLGDRSVSWAENLGLAALPFVSPLGYNLIKPITDYIRQEATTTQNKGSSPWYEALGDMFRTGANRLWTTIKDEVTSWFTNKRDSYGGTFGAGGSAGSGALGSTWQSIWNIVHAAIPEARINSTFRLGDPGYHGLGKAIDFGYGSGPGGAGSAGLASINRFLYDHYGSSLAELIYDGLYDDRSDIKNGHNLVYSAATRAEHQNHVHAAVYDRGGVLPPGLTLAYNGTGRDEYVSKGAGPMHITGTLRIDGDGLAHIIDGRVEQTIELIGTDSRYNGYIP